MGKKLVAYFSASGVTANVAKNLSEAIGADIFEIKPATPYTRADLDWNNSKARSTVEMNDETSRPQIAEKISDVSKYDTIFLGFPIWWYTAPHIINTFLESHDFSGKEIILFATSGGSSLRGIANKLKKSCPGAEILEGRMMNGNPSKGELKSWAESRN